VKIVRLEAENVKRLRAVQITPDGNTVLITGRNGQGKSSVLDAIYLALGGGAAARETPQPVRHGADHASVTVDLGDYRVTRTWNAEGTTSLRVESGDGSAKYKAPQRLLDDLVGRLSFDPLAFAAMPPRDQLAQLLAVVELPFDPAELDARRAKLYEDRTLVGREVKQLEGQLAGMVAPDPATPADEVNAADLVAEYEQGMARWDEYRRAAEQHRTLEDKVKTAEAALAAAQRAYDEAVAEYRAHPEPTTDGLPDLESVTDNLAGIDAVNAAVRAARTYRDVAARLDAKRSEQDTLTGQIEALDADKAAAIRRARMPIDGLGFTDDGVTYQGVPFQQASSAEQLRVSVAMARALNPTLRVMLIRDGSLLDGDNLALLAGMADADDFQVWIEVVDSDAPSAVVIEDGTVAGRG
jgi:hypothetical protein